MMKLIRKYVVVLAAGFIMVSAVSGAELRFNNYFTDNMVLQGGKPVLIKGFADKGATVTVSFAGQTKTAKAEDGTWAVTLDALSASDKPQKLTASSSIGNQQSSIGNVLVGDVLIFARQSFIDVSLGKDDEGKKAAQAFESSPLLRMVHIKAGRSGIRRRTLRVRT